MRMAEARGIDIHTHFVPSAFPAYAGAGADVPWPSMRLHDDCGHADVMILGKNYRTVPSSSWDAAERLAEMDASGLRHQVVSPMPELLSYWLPLADATLLLRHVNEEIAALCAEHPERFSGLGGVPLQDVEAAMGELDRVRALPGMHGVEIATHVEDVSIGDPRFEPFFAAAEALGVPIFVHGLRPAGRNRLVGPVSEQVVAFPGDVALAAASMISGGTIVRHPELRIAFSHGGGGFSITLPRMEQGWHTTPAMQEAFPEPPSVYARRMYYDSAVYKTSTLRYVIETFGLERVMIGTDYPFGIMDRDPIGTVDALALDDASAELLFEGNARRFLGSA